MHPTLASHICTSDCVHFIRSWCIYSVVSWLIIFSVICIPIIHCALHGLVDDRCNLRRYNSSTFYNPYLCPLPTKPCISCTIATRVINNWTSHTAHVTQRTVYCEDFTADPSVNAVCRYRGASLCFPMEISLTSPISAPRNLHLCPMPTSNLLQSSPHAALQVAALQVAAQNSTRTLTWRWKLGELKRQWLVLNLQGRPKIFTQLQSLRLQSCCTLFSKLKVIQDEAEEQVVLELPSLIIFPLLCWSQTYILGSSSASKMLLTRLMLVSSFLLDPQGALKMLL